MKGVLEKIIGTRKPIIAMAHFPPLPGTPLYDKRGGINKLVDSLRRDILALQDGGVDAIMFGNEGDRPYVIQVGYEVPTTMAAVIERLKDDIKVPFGVDVLWDPMAAIALAKAVGALWVREIFTNVYASDMGIWNTNCGKVFRYRDSIDATDVKLLFNVNAEFAAPVATRPLETIARSVVMSSLAEVICVSGPMTGEPVTADIIRSVKQAVPDDVEVFANTGVNEGNVKELLAEADGAIVGTSLKRDGCTWNEVDRDRVLRFMDIVRSIRG